MKNQEIHFSCHSCGKGLECSPREPPCEVFKDWLTISYWKGLGSVEHYTFCSFSCLKFWVEAQVPKIPKVFLESFKEQET